MIDQQSKIVLNEEDARLYFAFVEHRDKFKALLEGGLFNLREGKAEINCHNGQIQGVILIRQTYRRTTKGAKLPV